MYYFYEPNHLQYCVLIRNTGFWFCVLTALYLQHILVLYLFVKYKIITFVLILFHYGCFNILKFWKTCVLFVFNLFVWLTSITFLVTVVWDASGDSSQEFSRKGLRGLWKRKTARIFLVFKIHKILREVFIRVTVKIR